MDEPTRIIAIRHGETAWNAVARLQGQLDIPLNERGRAQAAALVPPLQREGITRIYASDLSRAAETARALAAPLGLTPIYDAGLRERGFGALEGHGYEEIRQRWPEHSARWHRRVADFAPPGGGESLLAFHARCVDTAERMARAHPGELIALVAHGGVLDCLYRAAARLALDAPRTWQLGNATINRLLYAGEGFTLVGWNDARHLEGLPGDELGA